MSDIQAVMKACEAIEAQLVKFAEKTEAEIKATGTASADTKAAIEGLSTQQRELADRITQVLTATREQYSAMQQHSLEAVKVHDLDRTLDTFEALYRGETPAK